MSHPNDDPVRGSSRVRPATRRVAVTVALVAALAAMAAPASALLGDYRLVTGTVTLWPGDADGFRVAVVEGDDGDRYFVRATPFTALPADLGPGARVAVVGREGVVGTELTASSIHPHATLSPGRQLGAWRTVRGLIESVAGASAVLQSASGRIVVDTSALGTPAVPIAPGRYVTIVGVTDPSGRLLARGVAD
jgi:hypothetical protein